MGKLGYIGNKIVVMLVSIGIFVFFMYLGEVNYGDFGMLVFNDVFVVIFNFGEIGELLNLLFVVKWMNVLVIVIINWVDSMLGKYVDVVLDIGVE